MIYLFRYGLAWSTRYVAKIDDDICLNVWMFQRTVRFEDPSAALYVGSYLFNGREYAIMKGADGTVAPFMSGPIEILSRKLARIIFQDLANYAALYNFYGSSSEDANLGKWIKHAQDLNLTKVKFVSEFKLQGSAIKGEAQASAR